MTNHTAQPKSSDKSGWGVLKLQLPLAVLVRRWLAVVMLVTLVAAAWVGTVNQYYLLGILLLCLLVFLAFLKVAVDMEHILAVQPPPASSGGAFSPKHVIQKVDQIKKSLSPRPMRRTN
jgi:hypothetical protein